MGFLQNAVADNGLEAPSAYHRIYGLSGNQERIDFTLMAYPSQEFFQANPNAVPLFAKNYTFTPNM